MTDSATRVALSVLTGSSLAGTGAPPHLVLRNDEKGSTNLTQVYRSKSARGEAMQAKQVYEKPRMKRLGLLRQLTRFTF